LDNNDQISSTNAISTKQLYRNERECGN